MKRYIVFGFDSYYPGGGMYDYHAQFDDLVEAKNTALYFENYHVLDTHTGKWWDRGVGGEEFYELVVK